jgi:O-antigen/teichoic acid export membrane protein
VLDSPSAGGKVIRGSVLRAVSYLAGVLLSVLSASLMIRHLGLNDWGRYVTVSSLLAVVTGLSEVGMSNIGLREYATLVGDARKRLLENLLGLRLGLTVLGILAAAVFVVAANYPSVLLPGTLLAGIGVLVAVVQQTAGIPLLGGLRLGLASVLDFVRQAATVAVVVALVAAGSGLLPFLAAAIPVGGLVLVLTLMLLRGEAPIRPRFDRAEWRRIANVTIAYVGASAVGTIYVSMTVIVISLVGTASETGYYGASFRIFSVLANIPLLLVGAAFPVLARAARDDQVRLQYAVGRLWEMALIIGALFALMLWTGASFAIRVVAGPGFDQSVPVLQILSAAILCSFVVIAFAYVLLSVHRHAALLVANSLALGGSLLLALLLVPPLGAKGAAIATLVGEFALAAGYLVSVLSSGLRLPLRLVPRVAAAAGIAAAVVLVPGLGSLGRAAAVGAVYLIVLFLLRGIPPEIVQALSVVRRRQPQPE